LDADGWEKLQELLDRALSLSGRERDAFLDQASTEQPDLADELRSLVMTAETPMTLLDGHVSLETEADMKDARLGPWRLLEQLDEGGMGSVYIAERADGVYQQRVALKIAHTGLTGGAMAERFSRERQILAGLHHPNIAGLLDGGTTPDGRPYLVMELVEGETLLEWARERPLRERLALFAKLCHAVDFAHRNLIVHRDLKPANILVAGNEPKLLDFGIARLLADEGGTGASNTRLMTPEYASPEQIRGDGVTTVSDIYSLGVILYELLTGKRPHDEAATDYAMLALILNTRPVRPSEVVSGPMERALRGDLDTITLMALRKEPDRRYPSADRLAEDIERYLEGFPVRARKETVTYLARKFIQRNAVASALTASLFLALMIGTVVLAYQRIAVGKARDRAEQESRLANKVSDYLLNVFSSADPYGPAGGDETARELLTRAVQDIETTMIDEPGMRATMLHTMGRAHMGLGLYPEAERLLEQAEEIRQSLFAPDHPDRLASRAGRARLASTTGDYETALALTEPATVPGDSRIGFGLIRASALFSLGRYAEARAILDEMETETPGQASERLHLLADIAYRDSAYSRVIALRKQALSILEEAGLASSQGYEDGKEQLALTYRRLNQLEEAERLMLEVMAVREQRFGPESAAVAESLHNLAWLYFRQGRFTEMREAIEASLRIRSEVFGPESVRVASTMNRMGGWYLVIGDYQRALEIYLHVADLYRARLATNHNSYAMALNNAGQALLFLGEFDAAENQLSEALRIRESRGVNRLTDIGASTYYLGELALRRGDLATAAVMQERTHEIFEEVLGLENVNTACTIGQIATRLAHEGRTEEALARFEAAIEILDEADERCSTYIYPILTDAGFTELRAGDLDRAAWRFAEAESIFVTLPGMANHPDRGWVLHGRALVAEESGDLVKACSLGREALALIARELDENHPRRKAIARLLQRCSY